MDINEMKIKLKESLKETRYIHSLNVMEESEKLAMHYNVDTEKAKIAGLLHDCAKNISKKDENELIKKYRIETDDIQRNSSAL